MQFRKTYKGKSYGRGYDQGITYLYYEYRGHEYMVEDRHWMAVASDMTLALQHQREQAKIDRLIDMQLNPEEHCPYDDSAERALDKLFAYFDGDDHAMDLM